MDYSNKKVAIIDDNAMNMKVANIRLKTYNIGVIDEYESAANLFKGLENKEYDLLLMDDMMPEMRGTEAMQKLKAEGFSKPIIVLTGNTESSTAREDYLSKGFDEFLGKPLNPQELDRVIKLFFK